jgi:hypothetical protein
MADHILVHQLRNDDMIIISQDGCLQLTAKGRRLLVRGSPSAKLTLDTDHSTSSSYNSSTECMRPFRFERILRLEKISIESSAA